MATDQVKAELARLEQAEESLLALFFDEIDNRSGDYFVHVGLPRDVSWGKFRRHYDTNGEPDLERSGADLASYPPVAAPLAARGVAVLTERAGNG